MKYTFGKATSFSFEETLVKVQAALKEEGFGVLTEIDVKATMKEKLGVDFRKYKILGACNPRLAHQAFSVENEIGALLPCNVIVYENDEGKTTVSIIDPVAALGFVSNEKLAEVGTEAKERLSRALDRI
jgi:uncharacterized protein (DUF302 family)